MALAIVWEHRLHLVTISPPSVIVHWSWGEVFSLLLVSFQDVDEYCVIKPWNNASLNFLSPFCFAGLFKIVSRPDWTDSVFKFVTYGTVVRFSATQSGDSLDPPCSTWGTAHHTHRRSRYCLLNPQPPSSPICSAPPHPDASWRSA